MVTLSNRVFDLSEAATLAGCGVRDLLELGAAGSAPLLVYVDSEFVDWGVYNGTHLEPIGGRIETGHFALEPGAIRQIAEKGHTLDPWLLNAVDDNKHFGCVWRGPRRVWRVQQIMLRISRDWIDKIQKQEIGEWTVSPLDSEEFSKLELREAETTKRDEWMYEQYRDLKETGLRPDKVVFGKIHDKLPAHFPTRSNIKVGTIRRILWEMKKKNRTF